MEGGGRKIRSLRSSAATLASSRPAVLHDLHLKKGEKNRKEKEKQRKVKMKKRLRWLSVVVTPVVSRVRRIAASSRPA